ncbi:hypothetical protein M3Y99_00673700 [Aphelenchoides fujianensis]|nr:hypothetical protein M3Y99_00673700 [Aphelenchoides fujianensis]
MRTPQRSTHACERARSWAIISCVSPSATRHRWPFNGAARRSSDSPRTPLGGPMTINGNCTVQGRIERLRAQIDGHTFRQPVVRLIVAEDGWLNATDTRTSALLCEGASLRNEADQRHWWTTIAFRMIDDERFQAWIHVPNSTLFDFGEYRL